MADKNYTLLSLNALDFLQKCGYEGKSHEERMELLALARHLYPNESMADSWKTDGNCKECRRNNYCDKPCSASKKALKRVADRAYREVMRDKGLPTAVDLLPEGITYE